MKMRWMLAFALAVATARGAGVPKTADEVIKFAMAKRAGYKTWSAEIRQSTSLMGMPITWQGQTWFKAPRSARTEVQIPLAGALGKMTLVMGGDGILWQDGEMFGQKTITKLDTGLLASNLTAWSGRNLDFLQNPDQSRLLENVCKFMDFKISSCTTIDNQLMWVVEATQKAETTATDKLRFYVGQQDGFTHRIEKLEPSGSTPKETLDYTKIKFNETLDDSMFQYKPPAGVQVIDITDMSLQMIQQGGVAPPGKSSTADKP